MVFYRKATTTMSSTVNACTIYGACARAHVQDVNDLKRKKVFLDVMTSRRQMECSKETGN